MMNDDESEDEVPTVLVGGRSYPVNEVMDNTTLIAKMSPHEKATYIQICQGIYPFIIVIAYFYISNPFLLSRLLRTSIRVKIFHELAKYYQM